MRSIKLIVIFFCSMLVVSGCTNTKSYSFKNESYDKKITQLSINLIVSNNVPISINKKYQDVSESTKENARMKIPLLVSAFYRHIEKNIKQAFQKEGVKVTKIFKTHKKDVGNGTVLTISVTGKVTCKNFLCTNSISAYTSLYDNVKRHPQWRASFNIPYPDNLKDDYFVKSYLTSLISEMHDKELL